MPSGSLSAYAVVRVKEDVENQIYNFNPSDAPLLSMIDRTPVSSTFHEWTRDSYRTPDPTRAAQDGADASYSTPTQPGPLNNRTQIVQDTVSVSGTSEAVAKYGRASEASRLKTKKMLECKRDIEAAAICSGASVTAASGTAGKMRGLYGFITQRSMGTSGVAPDPTTNTAPVDGTDRSATEAMLKTGLQTAYQNGGDGSILMVSPAHKVIVSGFGSNVQRTNEVGSKQPAVVNVAFDFYKSDFGTTKIVPNRVQAVSAKGLNDTMYLIDPDKIALGQLRPFQSQQLATVGDATNYQVLTEVTLIVRDEKPLYAITDITP
jgi:hypothetical protein